MYKFTLVLINTIKIQLGDHAYNFNGKTCLKMYLKFDQFWIINLFLIFAKFQYFYLACTINSHLFIYFIMKLDASLELLFALPTVELFSAQLQFIYSALFPASCPEHQKKYFRSNIFACLKPSFYVKIDGHYELSFFTRSTLFPWSCFEAWRSKWGFDVT